jgi:hypothetical protein
MGGVTLCYVTHAERENLSVPWSETSGSWFVRRSWDWRPGMRCGGPGKHSGGRRILLSAAYPIGRLLDPGLQCSHPSRQIIRHGGQPSGAGIYRGQYPGWPRSTAAAPTIVDAQPGRFGR